MIKALEMIRCKEYEDGGDIQNTPVTLDIFQQLYYFRCILFQLELK